MNPTMGSFGVFVIGRALRLDPPYWISIAVVILYGYLSAHLQGRIFEWPPIFVICAHLFYMQSVFKLPEINPVYWTLTYEIQFYLFFAAAITIAYAFPAFLKNAVWSLMFILAWVVTLGLFANIPTGLFVGLWPAFFVGVLAYYAPKDRRALGALLSLSTIMLWPFGGSTTFMRYAAGTALLLAWTMASQKMTTALNWRWLQFLGASSYSLYLLHNPISGAAAFLCRKIVGTSAPAELATLALIVMVSVAAAWLYWLAIERPAHALSRRLTLHTRMRNRSVETNPGLQ